MYIVSSGSAATCNWIPIALSSQKAGSTSSKVPSASPRQPGSNKIALIGRIQFDQSRNKEALRHIDLRCVVFERRGVGECHGDRLASQVCGQRLSPEEILHSCFAQRFA